MLNFVDAHILVVGDVMLDRYFQGQTRRISPEAPIPVVEVKDMDWRIGGAANVAMNLSALGARVGLLGLVGNDQAGQDLTNACVAQQIDTHLLAVEGHETIVKTRVVSQNQQMLRLDFERAFTDIDKTALIAAYETMLDACTVVVFSDYAKGTLSHIEEMIALAAKMGKTILVDPKGDDYTRYAGASLIKPNEREFLAVVGTVPPEEYEEKARELIETLGLQALLLTRGSQGMMLIQRDEPLHTVAATSNEVADVTGAGDTVIALLASALAVGKPYTVGMNLANLGAGIVVRKVGTATVLPSELERAYKRNVAIPKGVIDREPLVEILRSVQDQGKNIVFTNGCFDLVHAGHIAYLQKAREQGDHLVVGVNDDASIARIKGPSRPIAALESRMMVLAALSCVDWVVPFHEDTPENLLHLLKPDVLVKGTDYAISEIVGAEIVLGYGGKVQPISHEYGHYTTSKLIDRIKDIA